MRGWLLDTNVIAELTRDRCDPKVFAWAQAQSEERLFISVLTLGEYRKGIANLSDDDPAAIRYRDMLDRLQERFADRVLDITSEISMAWGVISGTVKRLSGHPPPVIDTLLAATAIRSNLYLATRNVRDVQHSGAAVFNPWSDDLAAYPLARRSNRKPTSSDT
jgi:predicted nucleic acid-binding protein